MAECEVDGCERRTHSARVHCEAHRWRLRAHGDVMAHIPVGRMRHGREMNTVPPVDPEEERRAAYEPTPSPGRGFLWLV